MTKTKIPKVHIDEKIENAEEITKYLHTTGLTYYAETIEDIITLLKWVRDDKVEVVER